MRNDRGGSRHGLIKDAIREFLWGDWGEPWNTSVRIPGAPSEQKPEKLSLKPTCSIIKLVSFKKMKTRQDSRDEVYKQFTHELSLQIKLPAIFSILFVVMLSLYFPDTLNEKGKWFTWLFSTLQYKRRSVDLICDRGCYIYIRERDF